MVKPENFNISFEADNTTFYSGQTINGQVRFRFFRPERAKALTIFFMGSECTYGSPAGTKRVVEEHEIFKAKQVLWEEDCGFFEAKTYTFPFKIELGAYNFPSSYEGEYANIRYKFKAVIDRPSRFGHSTSIPVTMMSAIPNFIPEFTKPGRFVTEGTYGTFNRETLQIIAETKFRSCCPGGKLMLDVAVFPRGTRSISSVDIKLIQEVEVTYQSKPLITNNTIATYSLPLNSVNVSDEDDQDIVKIIVPSTTPPTIETSNAIKVSYYLLVTGAVAWSYAPLSIKIPVQLSTLNVTGDEIPPLASGHHYLPPIIYTGEPSCLEEPDSPRNSRHSLTPSLTSDVSSLYSHDSDELDSRRRSIFQPNYAPSRFEVFPTHGKIFSPTQPLESPRTLI